MARNRFRAKRAKKNDPQKESAQPTILRIIGGEFGGRKLKYSGLRRTRPMQDRIREAAFNLLGPAVKGMHAVDLFAGTGALALEALSRGAEKATLIEAHFPSVAVINESIAALDVADRTEVFAGDVFHWWRTGPALGAQPWLVFVSPPYDFYVDRTEGMLDLISEMLQASPPGSLFVVESDKRFDPAALPECKWDVRVYSDTQLAIGEKAE